MERIKVYESKTDAIEPSGLPSAFVGGFPETKGPVKITGKEMEEERKKDI